MSSFSLTLWSAVVTRVTFVSKTGHVSSLGDMWHLMAVSHVPERFSLIEVSCLPLSYLLEPVSGTCHLPAVHKEESWSGAELCQVCSP